VSRNLDSDWDDDDRAQPGPDLGALLTKSVKRSWGLVVVLVILGGAAGLLYGAALPNIYESRAKLLLRLGQREQMTPEIIVGAGTTSYDTRPTMQDEIHLLSDGAIYERVARELGPSKVLEPVDPKRADGPSTPWHVRAMHTLQSWMLPEPGPESPHEDAGLRPATKVLQNNTTLHTERLSNVITVSHRADAPEKAHAIVQALVLAFIQRHRDQFSIQKYLGESSQQLEKSEKERKETNAAWNEHVQRCGFVDVDTQRPALLAEQTALESELATATTRKAEIASQLAALGEQMAAIPPDLEQVTPAVMIANGEYDMLLEQKRGVMEARRQLAFAGLPLDERARREGEHDKELERIDAQLRGLPPRITQTPEQRRKVPNPVWTELADRKRDLELEDIGLTARVAALKKRAEEKHNKLVDLQICEIEHEALISRRDEAKRKYTDLFDRYSKLQALGQIDIDDAANLRVLQPPTFDPEKVGPNRAKYAAAGLFGGMLLALALCLGRELLARRKDGHRAAPTGAGVSSAAA
jgi:uncharacterized protein involved in exopolysaccharide biosynthesis